MQPDAREGEAGRRGVAERFVVPLKPGNAGGGKPHTVEAAMCKYLAPKTAVEVIHQCLLTHGHYGWSMDLPHQQRLRDVRLAA